MFTRKYLIVCNLKEKRGNSVLPYFAFPASLGKIGQEKWHWSQIG